MTRDEINVLMPLGATDMVAAKGLVPYMASARSWFWPVLLDIAYDLLDNESLDSVRAWWRLRRLRKYKANKALARFQRGSYDLPAPKNPPRPYYEVLTMDGRPAPDHVVDSMRRARLLPHECFTTSYFAMLSSEGNESLTSK